MKDMRSFGREHWQAAQAAWSEGEFSAEWAPYRAAAAERGFIYPPDGSKWDSWGDDSPSQRAVLIQAIRERPLALMAIVRRSRSWAEVIGALVAENEFLRELTLEEEREAAATRRQHGHREAVKALKSIVDHLAEMPR